VFYLEHTDKHRLDRARAKWEGTVGNYKFGTLGSSTCAPARI